MIAHQSTLPPPRPPPRPRPRHRSAASRVALLLIVAGTAGCRGLSEQQEQMLVIHQQNSKEYYDQGDLSRAEDQARRGLALDADDRSLNLLLAYVLLRRGTMDALNEADEIFEDLDGGWGSADDFRLELGMGIVAMTRQRLLRQREPADQRAITRASERAREKLGRALELEPDCTEAVYQLALLAVEEGETAQFREHSDRAIELLDRSVTVKRRALQRITNPRQRTTSLRDLSVDTRRARELLRLRADLRFREQDLEGCLADLDQLEELGAFGRSDFYDRARVLTELNQIARAVDDYESFLEHSEELDGEVQKAIESLTTLRAQLAEQHVAGDGPAG